MNAAWDFKYSTRVCTMRRMKPRVLWSFVADQFIVDQGGKFSVIGVWETVSAPMFPAVHPQLFVVTGWQGDPHANFLTETRLWTPSGALLTSTGPHPFQVSPVGKGINVNQFVNVNLPQSGAYRLEVLAYGEIAYDSTITVNQLGTPIA